MTLRSLDSIWMGVSGAIPTVVSEREKTDRLGLHLLVLAKRLFRQDTQVADILGVLGRLADEPRPRLDVLLHALLVVIDAPLQLLQLLFHLRALRLELGELAAGLVRLGLRLPQLLLDLGHGPLRLLELALRVLVALAAAAARRVLESLAA